MPTRKSPRKGSLQFWPRKRAKKFLPRVNWNHINSKLSSEAKGLSGFICYKAGMKSAYLTDNTEKSMTAGRKMTIPCTILSCPHMKILSVRFYKDQLPISDILNINSLDKELKRKIKIPKTYTKKIEDVKSEDYDNLSIVAYSVVKSSGLKKTPDIVEIGLAGSKEDKLNFVKENLVKELSVVDFFQDGELTDLRGLTKGKGTQGPVKRFGLNLKVAKSEKGQRRPGSLGPWHPARVIFRVPMMGQMGLNTRVIYNNKIINVGKSGEKNILGLKNFGDVKTDYVVVAGSVQGPSKRQLVLTRAMRPTKAQLKKNYDFVELR